MKKNLFLLIVLAFGFNLYGQNDTSYIHTFGGIQEDYCRQVQPTPDGGYILIGTTNSFGSGNTSFYAIKTDSLCNFKWSKTYGGSQNQAGYSVTNTLDKGFAFVGFTDSYGAGGYDVLLVKTDSMGKEQWQQTYGGSNWDFGYSIQQLSDSGYIICGITYSYGVGNGNIYIIRTDKKGDTLWTKTAGGTGNSCGNAVYVLNDSIYLVAGSTTNYQAGDTNGCVLKIKDRRDSGQVLSTWYYGKNLNSDFYSIIRTYDKGYIMFGSNDSLVDSVEGRPYRNEYALKIDSIGKVKWGQLPIFTSYSSATSGAELANHSILSLGTESEFGAGEFDFHLQQFGPTGVWWTNLTFGGAQEEYAGSIAIGRNGDIIMAGSSNSYPTFSVGLFDIFMVRLKATDSIPSTYDTIVTKFIDTTQWPASVPKQRQNQVDVNVFPNPVVTSATILIQGSDFEKYTCNLYTINGESVLTNYHLKNIGHGQAVAIIQKGSLRAGEYTYEIISNGNAKVASGKLIME